MAWESLEKHLAELMRSAVNMQCITMEYSGPEMRFITERLNEIMDTLDEIMVDVLTTTDKET